MCVSDRIDCVIRASPGDGVGVVATEVGGDSFSVAESLMVFDAEMPCAFGSAGILLPKVLVDSVSASLTNGCCAPKPGANVTRDMAYKSVTDVGTPAEDTDYPAPY